MSDSAERRAQRKLYAQAYKDLPSREHFIAATQYEQARMQRAVQNGQLAVQKGSLAVAVLSQVPRDNEENKPVFAAARELLVEILQKGLAQLRELENGEEEDEGALV